MLDLLRHSYKQDPRSSVCRDASFSNVYGKPIVPRGFRFESDRYSAKLSEKALRILVNDLSRNLRSLECRFLRRSRDPSNGGPHASRDNVSSYLPACLCLSISMILCVLLQVILYRSGLVIAAASFVIAASTAFLPEDALFRDIIKQNFDLLYALGAGGLGLSLFLIHIYVTEIKRTLQALWALGVVGSLATYLSLAQPVGESLTQYVIDNATAVWFVGPLFAALTGLVFKEGNATIIMFCASLNGSVYEYCSIVILFISKYGYPPQTGLCYGKLEAGLLTFIIPTVLLGHLLHLS
ncbi:hypothetical protein HHK36_015954 [Tetracentron sinense]|uniref:Uncharacterized protein n=1 Tax=Tetracentron sinense TaxID=13715 RepID=A0A834Z375_TETSI|nr:hypothetical protein HHK36_015954 [Tetracentron sinense]